MSRTLHLLSPNALLASSSQPTADYFPLMILLALDSDV